MEAHYNVDILRVGPATPGGVPVGGPGQDRMSAMVDKLKAYVQQGKLLLSAAGLSVSRFFPGGEGRVHSRPTMCRQSTARRYTRGVATAKPARARALGPPGPERRSR